MSHDQLVTAWAEYDRLDALWLAASRGNTASVRGAADAHADATLAWVKAMAIGPRPSKRND